MKKQLACLVFLTGLSASSPATVIFLQADLSPESVVPKKGGLSPVGISTASGIAFFELDLTPGAPRMMYEIHFADMSVRDEITGIHFHFGHEPRLTEKHGSADGPNGPHLLNVFRAPREDDADLQVDFENNVISGIWDNSDLNFGDDGQRDPGDSVGIGNAADSLLVGDVYIQVHTHQFPAPNTGELRGQLLVVPEPSVSASLGLALLAGGLRHRRP